jgi:glycosyltransferase involved in cell wall biosynthesis
MMGAKLMALPDVPWLRYVGLLSEADRLRALEAATVVVVPSPLESLSLLALEGMAVGTPVLCNARADVLVDHCTRSHAGLYYSDRDEFVECTKLLVADRRLRERMGRNGQHTSEATTTGMSSWPSTDTLMAALPKVPGLPLR